MGSNESPGLFHAQTPYHLITAYAINLKPGPEAGDYLMLSTSFGKAKALMDALEHWETSPFESIMVLRSTYYRHKYLRRFVSKKQGSNQNSTDWSCPACHEDVSICRQ